MKKLILLLVFIAQVSIAQTVSNTANQALDPSFALKSNGDVVLSWVEKSANGVLFFRKVNQGPAEQVPMDKKASTHAEGMPKLAYKADGTCILLYEMNRPTVASRFNGDLLYAMEVNGVWQKPQYIHQDTAAGLSHSFGKIISLPNGEVGAYWLDVKLGPKGRTLVTASTTPGAGFGEMKILDNQTCECCRIDALADTKGNVEVIYRDLNDKGERDMGYIHSSDFGKTYLESVPLYEDHWKVNACPHAGPSLVRGSKGLEAAWYTGAEGSSGVKWAYQGSKKMILHLAGDKIRMPQLASNPKGETALVFAEIKQEGDRYYKQIGFVVKDLSGKLTKSFVSDPAFDCSYPAIIWGGKSWIIAFEAVKDEVNQVVQVISK
ncbi:MAG: hypothetical protein RJA67_12 [Bacteroidota bacterium]|jgi:hypothetical protein